MTASVAVEFPDGSVREFSPESWELTDRDILIMRWPGRVHLIPVSQVRGIVIKEEQP